MTTTIHRKFPCGKTSANAAPVIAGIQPGDREAFEAFQAAEGSERTRLFRANRPAIFRGQKALESGSHREATKARNVTPSPAAAHKPAARVQRLPADSLAALRADLRRRFPSPDKDRVGQLRFAVSRCAEIVAALPGRFPKDAKTSHLRTAADALKVLREKQ